jgi:hypothetical protein
VLVGLLTTPALIFIIVVLYWGFEMLCSSTSSTGSFFVIFVPTVGLLFL